MIREIYLRVFVFGTALLLFSCILLGTPLLLVSCNNASSPENSDETASKSPEWFEKHLEKGSQSLDRSKSTSQPDWFEKHIEDASGSLDADYYRKKQEREAAAAKPQDSDSLFKRLIQR